jgi:hypothetical protein
MAATYLKIIRVQLQLGLRGFWIVFAGFLLSTTVNAYNFAAWGCENNIPQLFLGLRIDLNSQLTFFGFQQRFERPR